GPAKSFNDIIRQLRKIKNCRTLVYPRGVYLKSKKVA
ncbi:MAG: hypothetical protein ACI8PV_002012, partial [Dinoroseobacter sp.]